MRIYRLPSARATALLWAAIVAVGVAVGCSSSPPNASDLDGGPGIADAAQDRATMDPDASLGPGDGGKAGRCASVFASDLTAPYGRLDGRVLAVLSPTDQQCPRPNGTHVIVQVQAGTRVYRMVVNVVSNRAPFDVHFGETQKRLVGPAFSEGWHADARLDYAADLGLQAKIAPFAPITMSDLVARLVTTIPLDARISIYAGTSGGDSGHLVHRNGRGQDGAIVLEPDQPNPRYFVFHFDEQAF